MQERWNDKEWELLFNEAGAICVVGEGLRKLSVVQNVWKSTTKVLFSSPVQFMSP